MKAIQAWRWADLNGRIVRQSFIVRHPDVDAHLKYLLAHQDFTLPVPMIVEAEEEKMNIVNQINAALNDIRTTLVALSEFGKTPDVSDQLMAEKKATYQLWMAMEMVRHHRHGKSIPWSDRKPQVEEEFS